jgi:hypothetical protein
MSVTNTLDRQLSFLVPPRLGDAVERAAALHCTTLSSWLREATVQKLEKDGVRVEWPPAARI